MACGCFISTACWNYSFFIRLSHWRNPQLKHFVGYPFGTSKKKASTAFYGTAFKKSSKRWMSRRGMGPPFLSWLCHSIWLLHLYNIVKIQTFSQSFPLTEFIAKAFCRLFLWNFKEKSINRFLWHSPSRKQASTIFYGTAFPIGRLPCRKGAKVAGTPLFLAVPQEAAESVSLEAPKR